MTLQILLLPNSESDVEHQAVLQLVCGAKHFGFDNWGHQPQLVASLPKPHEANSDMVLSLFPCHEQDHVSCRSQGATYLALLVL